MNTRIRRRKSVIYHTGQDTRLHGQFEGYIDAAMATFTVPFVAVINDLNHKQLCYVRPQKNISHHQPRRTLRCHRLWNSFATIDSRKTCIIINNRVTAIDNHLRLHVLQLSSGAQHQGCSLYGTAESTIKLFGDNRFSTT